MITCMKSFITFFNATDCIVAVVRPRVKANTRAVITFIGAGISTVKNGAIASVVANDAAVVCVSISDGNVSSLTA